MRSADGLWQSILPAFGIGVEVLRNRHGPCPGCGGRDRFRFDDKDGRGTWFCGGGGNPSSGDGYALISHVTGWDNTRAFREVQQWLGNGQASATGLQPRTPEPPPIGGTRTTQDYGLSLWSESVPGVAFHPYARDSKRINWEAGARRHKSVSGRVVGKDCDCILVPIRNIETSEVVAVQAINAEGKKQTFGPARGNGFICGNTLDQSIDWHIVEGWADAVSLVFHEYGGNACAFAACGINNLDALADRVEQVYQPKRLIIWEDAA